MEMPFASAAAVSGLSHGSAGTRSVHCQLMAAPSETAEAPISSRS